MTTEPVEIRMPEVGESMTSATLAAWLRQPGDSVKAGEPIAEVETDETVARIESPADGILDDIRIVAGTEGVQVGTRLGVIRRATASEAPLAPAAPPVAASTPWVTGSPIASPPPSPALLAGRGAPAATTASAPPASASLEPGAGEPLSSETPYRDEALTAARRVTAERMTNAKQTAPHFYLSIDCAIDRMLKRRAKANAAVPMNAALTLNDVIVRAAALALAAVPEANVAWTGTGIRRFARVDLAVAVAAGAGLITPIVRAADTKDLLTIAAELRDLTGRARDGKLAPAEYTGGTCTVSNLGMFGVSSLYPILNPPQACIFGIGAVEERPVVRKKKVRAASLLTVTLAADHRALDGATGADLLRTFRALLEDPAPLFA